MYHPIADYALIGDMRTTALVSRAGSIDWLCWPRHDSPAVFLRLLDDIKGGACSIALTGGSPTSRRYLPGTNILQTEFATPTGRAILLDFMPVQPGDEPDSQADGSVLRLLRCTAGEIAGSFHLRPTFDYARRHGQALLLADRSCRFEAGEMRLWAQASVAFETGTEAASAPFSLREGQEAWLRLSHHGRDPEATPREALDATHGFWTTWSARCRYHGPYRDAVLRSALCLKLLTYAPTGAIIAAPTASLPEAVPGNRNFDYRYSWLRDASFTVTSFVGLGYEREAAAYLHFLRAADPSRGRALSLMHAIDGAVPAETVLPHLAGWRGTFPVRIGNAAATQVQLDIYGEFLLALHAFITAAGLPATLSYSLPEILSNLVERVLAVRDEPDQGIWELRGPPQHMVHTKALLWVALDRAADIADRIGGLDPPVVASWRDAAQHLRAEYRTQGWNERRGAYTQAYGSDQLDAAVLRTVLFGAIPADDPRLRATLALIGRELGEGDLIYRYRAPDGLQGDEATFLACAFWRAGCLTLDGKIQAAQALFERLLALANDVGLFAEELDAATGEHRGNFPQGFTHMSLINQALRLQDAKSPTLKTRHNSQ